MEEVYTVGVMNKPEKPPIEDASRLEADAEGQGAMARAENPVPVGTYSEEAFDAMMQKAPHALVTSSLVAPVRPIKGEVVISKDAVLRNLQGEPVSGEDPLADLQQDDDGNYVLE